MKIPPELRVDALKMKDYCQAKVEKELAGLSPEERIRKIRDLVDNGPFGEWWKKLRSRDAREASGGSASAE